MAILAILSTVSVVGYLSFTEKAKQSNDKTLIAQLNTVLDGNEILNGKPKTMHDALKVIEEEGYLVEDLIPASENNEFLWNQNNNEFVILSKESLKSDIDPNLWIIVNDETSLNELQNYYSVYLGKDYVDTDNSVSVSNGFDVGENTTINKVAYSNTLLSAQEATIRANGGTLNVNDELDTIYHYGVSDIVIIENVAMESYHAYGEINNLILVNGRGVIEKSANVGTLNVSKNSSATALFENVSTINAEDITKVNASEGIIINEVSEIVSDVINVEVDNVDQLHFQVSSNDGNVIKVINIKSGTYNVGKVDGTSNLVIEASNIILNGLGEVKLESKIGNIEELQQVVFVKGDNVILRNLTICDVVLEGELSNKIVTISKSSNTTIENCNIVGTGVGVYITDKGTTNYRIVDSTIKTISISNGAGTSDENSLVGKNLISNNRLLGSIVFQGYNPSAPWLEFDVINLPKIVNNTFEQPSESSTFRYYLFASSYTKYQLDSIESVKKMVSDEYVATFVKNNSFIDSNEGFDYICHPNEAYHNEYAYYGVYKG